MNARVLISLVVVGVLTLILFGVYQSVYTAQDTTGWSAQDIALVGVIGTAILIAVVVGIFRSVTGGN